MTEKIESLEIHPMRGHSRGEWYCSLDDVAPSEEEAEYWAVFGITHRGNKHCLGEFPTKSAADTAAQGLEPITKSAAITATQGHKPNWKPGVSSSSRHGRKIIQIEVVAAENDSTMVDIFALCADGSIWRRGVGTGRHSGLLDYRWERIPLDGIEDCGPETMFGAIITSSH